MIPLNIRSSKTGLPRRMVDEDEEEHRKYDHEAWLNEQDGVRAVRTGRYRADEKMERVVWDRISWSVYPRVLDHEPMNV